MDGLYGDAEIGALFNDTTEIATMIEVERALARVQARLGIIPSGAADEIDSILRATTVDTADLHEDFANAGVAVPALVNILRTACGDAGAYVHWGATSQDITDTGLILRLRKALAIIEARLETVINALCEQAERHARTIMAGRTRSQIATPITLGLRIAGWLDGLTRRRHQLRALRPDLLCVQLGGASGSLGVYGTRGVDVMEALAAELDLSGPVKPWHSERGRLVDLANWCAGTCGTLGKMGGDLIVSGRSEIAETRAGAGGGSSTMPQKANPFTAEALVTLARLCAGHAATMQQVLIHGEERDGVAWAIEWSALPGAVIATGAALGHGIELARSIEADTARMSANLPPSALAEAAAFALAAHMPLGAAQKLVKDALHEEAPLLDALRAKTDAPVDWTTLADPAAHIGDAVALVERTVAAARA